MKYYIISLKNEYFNRILDGKKPFEFRKTFARSLEDPFLCAIYVSSPVQAVRGIVEFDRPIRGTIEELLRLAIEANYPFIEAVKSYLEGKKEGYALPIRRFRSFQNPISLEKLREICPKFRPPQSFYCLEKQQFLKLREYIDNYES